jgi:subtilisin family serine protease
MKRVPELAVSEFLVAAIVSLVLLATVAGSVLCQERYVPGEILVKFRSTASTMSVASINQEMGCLAIRDIRFIGVQHLRITSGLSVEEAVERYSADPNVEFAEPNYIGEAAQRVLNNAEMWPNDWTFDDTRPEYGFQWALDNWGQTGGIVDADIDAPQMWRMKRHAGSEMIVAILDTGIDWSHEDLAANIWQNPGEIVGDGIDNDENNYIDDIRGWDFIENDNDPEDMVGHGTHVAGIIGAVGNNGKGICGVCWSVKLMPVRILDDTGHGNIADLCLGIDYAMHGDAKIINLSLGNYPESQSLEFAVDRANDKGVLVVASAGNSGRDIDVPGQESYPGSLPNPNVITVAASDENDLIPVWSNWGAVSVDLAAPGVCVYSTMPDNFVTLNGEFNLCTGNNFEMNYDYMNGTSMAAPHVSGVAALCWSLEPGLSHLELRDEILSASASFNAAEKEKKSAFQLGGAGEVVTEGRLRAAQNADFGDASDPPYPTLWPPLGNGPLHLDCGLEWLGYDVSLERDALNIDGTDTDGIANMIDNDGFLRCAVQV